MKTKIKREDLIDRLIDYDCERYADLLRYYLKNGVTGYVKYENKELIEYFKYYKSKGLFEDYADEIEIID